MNQTDTSIFLKRYYDMLYPSELRDNEYVCLFFLKENENQDIDETSISFHKYVKNFEEYQRYIEKYKYKFHIFNCLTTVKLDRHKRLSRKAENMRQRRVLFIDFDKKDFPEQKDAHYFTDLIKSKFPTMFLHACYDSGHGYHYYISIKPSCNNKEISLLNKELCSLVGADTNACKVTQIARIPCTYNRKSMDENGKFPLVTEVFHYKQSTYTTANYHPYSMQFIRQLIENVKKEMSENLQSRPKEQWDYDTNGFDVPVYNCLCTERIFHEGADKGERNVWLGRLIYWMKQDGCLQHKIVENCLLWNERCRPPKSRSEIIAEIEGWIDWIKRHKEAKINGCYWNIEDDERIREIVEKQCDKVFCKQYTNSYESMEVSTDIGVKMNQKVLTDKNLSVKGSQKMSGYEYLVLTVLDKYMPKEGRALFTVKNLKYRMQWKHAGKWDLCMDITTLKSTLDALVKHKCITLSDPPKSRQKNKKITYDDKVIKITKRLKELDSYGYIVFYYSAARAFISHQITQNEYKVYLCLLRNMKNSRSCTLNGLEDVLNMGKRNIVTSIQNLEKASLLRIHHRLSTKTGNQYNQYILTDTDRWDSDTDIGCDNESVACEVQLLA